MALKTTGSLEADSFKATTASASTPGFVTNDATGLLEYGQSGASTPVGASVWDFIEHKVLPSETDCLTFSGLTGNADKIYKLVFRNLLIPSVLEFIDSSNYMSGEDLVAGEVVTGDISGATATVDSFVAASVGSPGSVLTTVSPSGTFLDGEVVTGVISGFAVTIATGGQSFLNTRYTIKPNGLITNQRTTTIKQETGAAAVVSIFSEMIFMNEQDSVVGGVLYLFAKTGKARIFYGDSSWADSVATRIGMFSSYGHWTDTTAGITSLDVCSSLANGGLPAGSLFTLYKINS
ncbi:MAG: hypothetical protein QQN63_05220 [Nitrosopumilus sp.]